MDSLFPHNTFFLFVAPFNFLLMVNIVPFAFSGTIYKGIHPFAFSVRELMLGKTAIFYLLFIFEICYSMTIVELLFCCYYVFSACVQMMSVIRSVLSFLLH